MPSKQPREQTKGVSTVAASKVREEARSDVSSEDGKDLEGKGFHQGNESVLQLHRGGRYTVLC